MRNSALMNVSESHIIQTLHNSYVTFTYLFDVCNDSVALQNLFVASRCRTFCPSVIFLYLANIQVRAQNNTLQVSIKTCPWNVCFILCHAHQLHLVQTNVTKRHKWSQLVWLVDFSQPPLPKVCSVSGKAWPEKCFECIRG